MQALEREIISTNWITILLLISSLILVALKIFKSEKLKAYTFSIFNKGFLEIEADERESAFSIFHLSFTAFTFIIISLTAYFLLVSSGFYNHFSFQDYAKVSGFFLAYVVLRIVIEYLLILLFELKNALFFFYLSKRGYFYSIAVGLGFVLLVYVYGFSNTTFLFSSVGVLFIARLALILNNNKNLIISQLFYFILYLCAFELAPLLILIKLITS